MRKAAPRRNKHSCRVCARPVCEAEGSDLVGCCRKARIPKRLWHRTLAKLRKEETKFRRMDCEVCLRNKDTPASAPDPNEVKDNDLPAFAEEGPKQSKTGPALPGDAGCSCAEGWLCVDCESQVSENSTILDELQHAIDEGNLLVFHDLSQNPLVLWLLTLDCEDSDDANHFAGLSQRLMRIPAMLSSGTEPSWPRPAAKPRSYKSQVAHSALEAFNFVAGGKLRLAVQSVKLAARGYAFSEYILSEEFIIAWRLLLDQLGEFVDAPAAPAAPVPDTAAYSAARGAVPDADESAADMHKEASAQPAAKTIQAQTKPKHTTSASYRAQATQAAVVTTERAAVAFDLCKRFYYYSLHLTLERLKQNQHVPPSLPTPRLTHLPPLSSFPPKPLDSSASSAPEVREAFSAEQTGDVDGGWAEDEEEARIAKILDEASEYLHMTALLYDSSDSAERRPSMDSEAEAAWFLQKSLSCDGFVLLDYMPEAGEDRRQRSKVLHMCPGSVRRSLVSAFCVCGCASLSPPPPFTLSLSPSPSPLPPLLSFSAST